MRQEGVVGVEVLQVGVVVLFGLVAVLGEAVQFGEVGLEGDRDRGEAAFAAESGQHNFIDYRRDD